MKKNTIAFVVLLVLAFASSASAQTFVENWNVMGKGEAPGHYFDGQLDRAFDKSQGIQVWGVYSEQWSELYPSYYRNLTPWMTASLGAGWEQAGNHLRTAMSLWMGKGRFSSFLAVEHGADTWYSFVGTMEMARRVKAGVFSRRYVGTGPYLSVNVIGKAAVWMTYCPDSGRAVLGLKQGF